LGALPLSVEHAAAQSNRCGNGSLLVIPVCSNNTGGEGGEAEGGWGGNGSFAAVGGVGNVFAAGGNAQAGSTGGYGIAADASGGNGGDASAGNGGEGGNNDSCTALLGCFDLTLSGLYASAILVHWLVRPSISVPLIAPLAR